MYTDAQLIFNEIRNQRRQLKEMGKEPKYVYLAENLVTQLKDSFVHFLPANAELPAKVMGLEIIEVYTETPIISVTTHKLQTQEQRNVQLTITQEQLDKIREFYEEETEYYDTGDRDAIGANSGILGLLEIIGLTVEGVND